MRTIVVVTVMVVCVAVLCDSAAFSKHQYDVRAAPAADAGHTGNRWLFPPGLTKNRRYAFRPRPSTKRVTAAQKRRPPVSRITRRYDLKLT